MSEPDVAIFAAAVIVNFAVAALNPLFASFPVLET
jgi:hypothetical protein